MKALSLWQPWASAIVAGAKRIETRHWATRYRGPLMIHAAKRKNVSELMHYHACWNWIGAMRPIGWSWGKGHGHDIDELPFGALVATCTLIDCRPTDSFTLAELHARRRPAGEFGDSYDWTEHQMGNFELGRFGWVLADVKPLAAPIPFKGMQGLFDVPDHFLKQAA